MTKYQIIYADPPWEAKESGSGIRGTADLDKRYNGVMKTSEICSLPIDKISSENAILFLWATFPRLEDAMCVIQSWGFVYYGLGFNWIKTNKKSDSIFWGMGYYTRQNSEICLIGVKPNKTKRIKPLVRNIHSVVFSKIDEHSKKPVQIRDMIVKICGDVPRIELFAREKVVGWDSYGNEILSDIEFPVENKQ